MYPNNLDRNGALLKISLSTISGIGIFIGVLIAFKRANTFEKSVRGQVKSQIDERFKNAIEHLGNDKKPIILGGIAELHQIAKENPKEYAEVVFDILCSYLRNSNNYKKTDKEINNTISQSIVNNLFKRYQEKNYPYNGLKANLRFSNFTGINFDNANLNGSDFSFCYMPSITNAIFKFSTFHRTIFLSYNIDDVDFSSSDMFDVIFDRTRLKNTKFEKMLNFSQVTFLDTNITCNVSFNNTKLYNCKFLTSFIDNISFIKSDITSTSFAASDMTNIDWTLLNKFSRNDLRLTGLRHINIKINIEKSILRGCRIANNYRDKLSIVILKNSRNSNLEGINIAKNQLIDCDYSEFTDEDANALRNEYNLCKEKIYFEHNNPKNKKDDVNGQVSL
ncbi:pentapeptide repeat-containing protein [Marinifilum flexuosum]|uniref:Uncharacterized protein YjbI with pentapeptide repeats n=1 Tax=Marinifilum flexuosum TaxID=1117708 RepID=A0A419WXM1_9BACT|nr:pentapeptide repeat-containing protein [Marinifilum flexuosum]RKE00196.1 uncharacterized protein YjbI with pentapeptide repeats [Marinifilum flexuosum]